MVFRVGWSLRNGDTHHPGRRFTIDKSPGGRHFYKPDDRIRAKEMFHIFLDDLSRRLKPREGTIDRVYSLNGKRITDLDSFEEGNEYVGCPLGGRFSAAAYTRRAETSPVKSKVRHHLPDDAFWRF